VLGSAWEAGDAQGEWTPLTDHLLDRRGGLGDTVADGRLYRRDRQRLLVPPHDGGGPSSRETWG